MMVTKTRPLPHQQQPQHRSFIGSCRRCCSGSLSSSSSSSMRKILFYQFLAVILFSVVGHVYWRSTQICSIVDGVNIEQRFTQPMMQQQQQQKNILKEKDSFSSSSIYTKDSIDFSIFDISMANYTGPARAFSPWIGAFPCFPIPKKLMLTKPSQRGLLFQRPHKTGSTTLAGIVMRVAERYAKRQLQRQQQQQQQQLLLQRQQVPLSKFKSLFMQKRIVALSSSSSSLAANNHNITAAATTKTNNTISISKPNILFCDHRANHGTAVQYQYAQRDKQKSFLFSIVRNPTRRILSYFFHFMVTVYQVEPTDTNFRKQLLRFAPNHLLKDLSVYPVQVNHNKTNTNTTTTTANMTLQSSSFKTLDYHKIVQDVLNEYNFIALQERFDESLIVLKMLLHLDFDDILYVKERSEGTFSNGDKHRPCVYIRPSFLTSGMKEFLTSDAWLERIKGDILLYQAVHKSLDLTIDRLGRDEFQRQLTIFQKFNRIAQEKCASRSVGMCSVGGDPIPKHKRTCYIWSEGCSHACLDEIHIPNDAIGAQQRVT